MCTIDIKRRNLILLSKVTKEYDLMNMMNFWKKSLFKFMMSAGRKDGIYCKKLRLNG